MMDAARTTDLDRIIQVARTIYEKSPVELDENGNYYGVDDAALEAIKKEGMLVIDLACLLVKQTTLTVQNTSILNIFEGVDYKTYTWEELFRDISRSIIYQELMRRYPAIRKEENKRSDEEEKLWEKKHNPG